jgi:NAD(P)-dependent dehydrogenase (short-subunit alcohol dehydrogenase family)
MSKLEGKKVLVVGGSSGIGEASAQALAALGAQVTIASRDPAKLQAAAGRIGGAVRTAVLDTPTMPPSKRSSRRRMNTTTS